MTLLADNGRDELNEHDLEIVFAVENDAIRIVQGQPTEPGFCPCGGGYAQDSRGNYRENFGG